ncbi:MAG: OB-fold nucleic acid binding domain-containing protein [Pirellulaceae bacterium]|jgi:3'-5' exoribonuclease|nr:OB-fold nucleic acid binding domain-containing protein [Pirellulaceae bacterium]MDP7017569.1 OB-fold nucleic acid binding domain-containing protein [Pirellulaceae bacterium]
MSRRFVNQLGEGEQIDQIFLASEKQLRSNRNGNLYLQVRLADRTGSLTGMLWNANEKLYNSFENGDYLRIVGATQVYNGGLQVILNRVEKGAADQVDEADFVTLNDRVVDELAARMAEMLRSVRDVHLRNLAECFLIDESFMAAFSRAPAGVKHHHAYHGGLLQHVVDLMELSLVVAPRYPQIDADLLLMGAFLHDVGKIEELTFERDLGYSDAGQLIGHLVIGVSILDKKVAEAESLAEETFPEETKLRLQHMILSHNGLLEHGSPKVPMTMEALTLHLLDTLDAKVHAFHRLIQEDSNTQSAWTTYFPALQRKIFKGSSPPDAG